MRTQELVVALALTGAVLAPATAQEAGASNPQYEAERKAAGAAMLQVEKLLNAGQRGPESEPCKLMEAYFLHIVKAAAAAGAQTRVADWTELTWREQDAVKQKVKDVYERNTRLRTFACTAKP